MPTVAEKPEAKAKEQVKPAQKLKQVKKEEERPVRYEQIKVKVFEGNSPLTANMAKELLGWEEETEENKFGGDYLLTDENGVKVRCLNNSRNRPFTESWARTLAQDILNRHFAPEGPNGETIIIGKTGLVTSGQHRLVGLILAAQMWAGPQKHHWHEKWETEPAIDTLLVTGVSDSALTTRTLDNVRPRSLSDVLFTSDEFARFKPKDRKPLCSMTDHAVRLLWKRTGADDDAFSPKRTHSEALDFISRHPKILKAVKHIYEENSEGAIGTGNKCKIRIGPGYASGLMYLMAASDTDMDDYRNMEHPGERKVNFEYWDKAEEFWVLLASGQLKEIKKAFAGLTDPETGADGSITEKIAILAKAWALFKQGYEIKDKDLKLEYHTDEDGTKMLAEYVTFGGIDAGDEPPAKEEEGEAPQAEEAEEEVSEYKQKKKAKAEEIKKKLMENREKLKKENGGEVKKTRKQIEAEQTERAKKADEEMAKEAESAT